MKLKINNALMQATLYLLVIGEIRVRLYDVM